MRSLTGEREKGGFPTMGIMLLVMLPLLVVCGVFVALLIAGAVAQRPAPQDKPAPRDADPKCGQCGYVVRGIPSFTCPECGSDLRDVGIDIGKRRGGAGRIAVIGLTVVWALFMWLAGGLIDMAI